MKKIISAVIILVSVAFARAESPYKAGEYNIDIFGSARVKSLHENPTDGVGVGVSHFITKRFGIGADVFSENTHDQFIDQASASAIFRLPIGETKLSLYSLAGCGWNFEHEAFTLHGGGGLEYRISPHVGAFVEARYVYDGRAQQHDSGIGRSGIRFAF